MKLLVDEKENSANYYIENVQNSRVCGQIDKESLGRELMDVLKNGDIRTLFQPIVSLKDGAVLGYEALSRGPRDSVLESPSDLFDVARVYDKLWEVEFLCRIKALERVANHVKDSYIFLNVDPAVINDEKFKSGFTKGFLKKYNIDTYNIIFEITEKNAVNDFKSFRAIIDHYKDEGYKIAIDDTGSGYSGLLLISEIHPHYIKLDMNLIRDIDKDGLKKSLIKTFCDFCTVTDIKLIAEGIENENELNTLIEMGIDYGQGFFIQRPDEKIKPIRRECIKLIENLNAKRNKLYTNNSSKISVCDIARKNQTVNPDTLGCEIISLFEKNPSLQSLPVVENKKVLGLIMKENFFAKMGTKYGFTLYLNRPISLVMNNHPLIVDSTTTIDTVSKMAMTRDGSNLYDVIIVTESNQFYGIVTVKDLLEKTTEIEINYAKHLNPLSGLPGNMHIEAKLTELLRKGEPFTVLYLDIDNFKAYNDAYGFENGDRMIQTVVKIIDERVCGYMQRCDCFTGHIGGDDFVICVNTYDVSHICESIIDDFAIKKEELYTPSDYKKGYVKVSNRKGKVEKINNVTLSIACITNKDMKMDDIYELSKVAAEAKKECKEVRDNHFVIY